MKALFVIAACALALAAQSANPGLEELSWISGCWEMKSGARTTVERWGRPTSDMLIGVSQTVKDRKTISYELLRIVQAEKGPSYVARPSTAKEDTEFKFARGSKSEIVFENLQHDFPQRIIYRSGGEDKLTARVEGEVGGKLRGNDFPMTRVPC